MSSNSSGFRVRRHLSFVELPYRGQSFYLDIKAASVKARISERIISLGGQIECFLSKDLSLLITDRDVDKAPEQGTLQLGLKNAAIPLSRGQALLLKAAENTQNDSGSNHDLLQSASNLGVKTQTASIFIKTSAKLLAKIKRSKKAKDQENDPLCGMSPISWDKEKENLYTIKIEDSDGLYRPLFKQFDLAPTINYNDTGSPFDVGVVLVKQNENNQSKKKAAAGAVKGGYCESCDHWYKCTLREHLKSSKHKQFVASLENFTSLDSISSQLPSLNGFLTRHGLPCDTEQHSIFASSDVEASTKAEGSETMAYCDNKSALDECNDYQLPDRECEVADVSADISTTIPLNEQVARKLLNSHSTHTSSTRIYQENSDMQLVNSARELNKTRSDLDTDWFAVHSKTRSCMAQGSQLDTRRSRSQIYPSSRAQSLSRGSSVHSDRKITVDDVLKSVFNGDEEEEEEDGLGFEDEAGKEFAFQDEDERLSESSINQRKSAIGQHTADSGSASVNRHANLIEYSEIHVSSVSSGRQVKVRQNGAGIQVDATFSSSCSFGDLGVGNVISFLQSNDSCGSVEKIHCNGALDESASVGNFNLSNLNLSVSIDTAVSHGNDLNVNNSADIQIANSGSNGNAQSLRTDSDVPNTVNSLSQYSFGDLNSKVKSSVSSDGRSGLTLQYNYSSEKLQDLEAASEDVLQSDVTTELKCSEDFNGVNNCVDTSRVVKCIPKQISICNPDYSNITEESTSQEFPKIIDSLISLNNAGHSPVKKRTPHRQHSLSLRKQILANVANSGSTVRNWLLPHDENASDVTVLSTGVGNDTLVEKEGVDSIGESVNQGSLDDVEAGDSTGMVADWIKNHSFDAASDHDNNMEMCDNGSDVCGDNQCAYSLDNGGNAEKSELTNLESEYNGCTSDKPSDWSDGTSISDCTLSQFRHTHEIIEKNKIVQNDGNLVPSHCQEYKNRVLPASESVSLQSSLSVQTGASVKSGLSSSVTKRGIKIKGLSALKSNSGDSLASQGEMARLCSQQDIKSDQYAGDDFQNGYVSMSQENVQVNVPSAVLSDTRTVICKENISSMPDESILAGNSANKTDTGAQNQIKGKATKSKQTKKAKSKSKPVPKPVSNEPHNCASPFTGWQKQQLMNQQIYSPISMPSDSLKFQYGSPQVGFSTSHLHTSSAAAVNTQSYQQHQLPVSSHQSHCYPNQYTNAHQYQMAGQQTSFLQSMTDSPQNNINVNIEFPPYEEPVPDFLLSPQAQQQPYQQQPYQQPSNQVTHNNGSHLSFLSSSSNFLFQQSQCDNSNKDPKGQNSTSWYPSSVQTNAYGVTSPAPGSFQTICLADIAEESSKDSAYSSSLNVKPLQNKSRKSKAKVKPKSSRKSAVKTASDQSPMQASAQFGAKNNQSATGGGVRNGDSDLNNDYRYAMNSNGQNTDFTFTHTTSVSQPSGSQMYAAQAGNCEGLPISSSHPSQYAYNYNIYPQQMNFPTHSQSFHNMYMQGQHNMYGQNSAYSMPAHSNHMNMSYVTTQPYNQQSWSQNSGYQYPHPPYPTSSHQSGQVYNAIPTGETKLRLQKVHTATAPSDQQNNLMDYWNVRKSGDCRLVFSTAVAGKRKVDDVMSPNSNSPYDTPMSGYKYSTDESQPQSKRRRCLVY